MGDLSPGDGNPPPWLELLAPLPDEARPVRQPVLSDEIRAAHADTEVASWTSLVLHLAAPPHGLRVLLATVDRSGRVLTGSDLVHRRTAGRLEQHSVSGRFEENGTFAGTHWEGTAPDTGEDTAEWDLTPSTPPPEEVARLTALIAELVRRATL